MVSKPCSSTAKIRAITQLVQTRARVKPDTIVGSLGGLGYSQPAQDLGDRGVQHSGASVSMPAAGLVVLEATHHLLRAERWVCVLLQEQNQVFVQASCVCAGTLTALLIFHWKLNSDEEVAKMSSCKAVLRHCYLCLVTYCDVALCLFCWRAQDKYQGDHNVLTPSVSEKGVHLHIRKTLPSFPVNHASLEDFLPELETWEKTDVRGEVLPPKTLGAVLQVF